MRALPDLSTYLVLDPGLCHGPGMIETARVAAAAGVGAVQLRHKHATTAERVELGRALQTALVASQALLVVNDDVEAAIALDAPALHIGQKDMSAAEARARIGPHMLLGLSVHTAELAAEADPDTVDYLGAGPVFATSTKGDHDDPTGFDGLRDIVTSARVPCVAIGGLRAEHAGDVVHCGAVGMAVVSAICGQPDVAKASVALVAAWQGAHA